MAERQNLRLWPAAVIVGLVVAALVLILAGETGHRQGVVMRSMGILLLGIILLTIWALAFSRLPGRLRIRIAITGAGLLILASATMRIGGVTGDFIPILAWRWSAQEYGTVTTAETADGVQIGDYTQFLGPTRNAVLAGKELLDWQTHPPKEVWRVNVGSAWSAFAVSGRMAVTQEQREEEECVVAYDLLTGNQKWIHTDGTRYATPIGGIGPRATPTISGNHVYTIGATGLLNCLDLTTEDLIWHRDLVEEHDATIPTWGLAGSPLIVGDAVIVSPGGKQEQSLVAYKFDDGTFLWGGGTAKAGFSSPSLHRIAGKDQIIIFNAQSVASHDPASGLVYWQMPWPGGTECVSQPLPIGESRLFVSSGYGIGCKMYEISESEGGMKAELVYETPRMKAKFTQVVHHEGYLYVLDDGVMVCLDPNNGERMWKRGRYGHGQILLVGSKLIVQTEDGEVVLMQPNPQRLTELARIPALDSKTWNNPVLAGSLLILRNDREAVCYVVEFEDQKSI